MKFRETTELAFSPINLKTYTKFDGFVLAITFIGAFIFGSVISIGVSFMLPYIIFRHFRFTPLASLIGAILILIAFAILFVFLLAGSLAKGRV
jgi:hypothetical protein